MTKRTKTVVIIVAVLLGLAIIGLSIALGIVEKRRRDASAELGSIYEKSYYETVDCMSDVSLKLTKISALSGRDLKRELLYDIWRECDIAATNFSQLGTESEEINKVVKFFNQLGDYCYYLSVKLKKSPLSREEEDNLSSYGEIVASLNASLAEAQGNLKSGKTVGIVTSATVESAVQSNSSVEYPEMIYDGPFSDGLSDRTPKFLEGKAEISSDDGLGKISEYFSSAADIEYIGEGTASIPTYLYEFSLGRNHGTAQLSKAGGYLVMYNAYCEINDPTLSEEDCVKYADGYLEGFGYGNMKAVWVSNDDSTVYINYAYCENDIIFYPDLIKVKICSETGDLIGLEAQNFLYNHTAREITFPSKQPIVNEKLKVKETNRCLIPTEWNTEIPAIEIVAEKDGFTFYIYLDPESGEEVRAMVVIEEKGKMLI